MGTVPSIPTVDSESGLSRYLQEIRKFPLLMPDEEFMLAKSWQSPGRSMATRLPRTVLLRAICAW